MHHIDFICGLAASTAPGRRSVWVALGLALALQACGGGGGDTAVLPAAAPRENVTPVPSDSGGASGESDPGPGPGSGPTSNPDAGPGPSLSSAAFEGCWSPAPAHRQRMGSRACTHQRQRNWVYANLLEDYLFYRDMPSVDANAYAGTPVELFYDLTPNALPAKDRFSFVVTQAETEAVFQAGEAVGIGATYAFDSQGRLRVLYVEAAGSAAGRLSRGAQIVSIDGTPVARRPHPGPVRRAVPQRGGWLHHPGRARSAGSATQQLKLGKRRW